MSKRAFDILPPYPKEEPRTYHHHSDKGKKEKKSLHTFFVFVFGIFFIYVLFVFAKNNDFNVSTATNTNKSQGNTADTNFELFNNQGESNLANTNDIISVKIQDSTTQTGLLSTAKDLLLKNGFEIASSGKSTLTPAPTQTTIYYKSGNVIKAQKAQDALAANFKAAIQESSALGADYDLLIELSDR